MPEMRAAAIRFAEGLGAHKTPAALLDALNDCVSIANSIDARYQPLNVFGAWRTPRRRHEMDGYVLGENVFYHSSVPAGFFEDMTAAARANGGPSVLLQTGWLGEGPFTFSECMRSLRPIGKDRWIFDLLRRYGMRDGVYCPVNRWMVVYWSRQVLDLSIEHRALLHFMAVEAAGRLAKMAPPDKRNREPRLSARELAVLRHLSRGLEPAEIAKILGLATSTVKVHIENAKAKLDAKTRTHAVAKAIRCFLMK